MVLLHKIIFVFISKDILIDKYDYSMYVKVFKFSEEK